MSTTSEQSSLICRCSSPNTSNEGSQLTSPDNPTNSSKANNPSTQISIIELQKQRKAEIQDLEEQMKLKDDKKRKYYDLYQSVVSDQSKIKQKINQITKFYNQGQRKINGIKIQRKQYSDETKDKVAKLVNEKNMERSEVSDILDVSYQSTCRFAKQNGSKSRKKYRAPNSKLNDEHMISLMELIEDNAGLTQRKLREHLKKNLI